VFEGKARRLSKSGAPERVSSGSSLTYELKTRLERLAWYKRSSLLEIFIYVKCFVTFGPRMSIEDGSFSEIWRNDHFI
jgi:hypothetical protein